MKTQKYINCMFAVLLVVVFAYFFFGECFLSSDRVNDYDSICTEYTGKWERLTKSGMREEMKVPGKCKAERNETVVLETTLPDTIEKNQYLCFRSAKQEMKFYVDGKLRQEYSTKENRLFGRMNAAAYVFLELEEEDTGKVLRVETKTDSSYSGVFYTVYYGNPMGIWKYFFRQFGLELVVAFLTLVLSVIAIIGSTVLGFFYRRKLPLFYLGWGIAIAAVWLITNSSFRQLIFPNLSIVNDITFLMIMLLALPYLIYMNEIQKGRYQKAYHVLEILVIINFFLCCILHITRWCDFTDSISGVFVFCILSILLILITIFKDIRKGKIREYSFVALGMLGVCVAAFIQIMMYFQRSNLFNGAILAVGLIFLLLFSTISTIHEIMYMDREKQQALQASESKGRFLANMSHEIRTPIHAVLGMDAMILRESKEEQIREYALDIQNAGQTLLSLINDILDISKIESGKLEILPVEYDFSSLIHDIMNMMEMKAKDKGLELQLFVDEKIPSRLWGDDVRIRQILVNLMSNAIKYTEKGSVTLVVSAECQEDMAILDFRVKDTGIGIRDEDIEKLFVEFERIEEQRNRNIEGTGLGMAITTQLLERMESKLQVESVYGEGSVFSFHLKQPIRSKEPIGDLEQRIRNRVMMYSYQVMFTAPDAQVLIVDDNAVNRRVFSNLLKPTKIQIEEAGGGEECLMLVRKKKYDLIFLDHMMPDLDGVQVLREMKKWEDYPCKETPVIALTANAVTGAREMYLKEGFWNFLSKPVNPEKLEKMIMETLPPEKVSTVLETETKENKEEIEMEFELPQLEGIDWNYAKLYCKEMEILKDTVQHFYQMIETEAAQLETFLELILRTKEEQAFRQFKIKVHSMKNSASMIGAIYLAGVARMLEYAARDEKADVLQNVTPVFLDDWMSMKEILKPVVEKGEEEEKEPVNYNLIKEMLQQLRDSIYNMDIDTADEMIQQLKRFEYVKPAMVEAMENLCLAVTNLDEEQTELWSSKLEQELR